MAGDTTRAEANRSFFVYVTEPNTNIVRRVAVPADLQVGLEGRPAELQLFGRFSLCTTVFNVDSDDSGVINVSNDDTVAAVSLTRSPSSGRITVHLPGAPREGQLHFVKDASGTASTVPIDVMPDTGTFIDGDSVHTLSDSYSSLALVWSSDRWLQLVAGVGLVNASSGSSGGSLSASYLTVQDEPGLSNQRVIATGLGLKGSDGGPGGQFTLSIDDSVVMTLTSSAFTGSLLGNMTGSVLASGGLSGSLQQLASGDSYLVAGTGISVVSQSNGQVVVSALYNRFSLELFSAVSSTAQDASNVKKIGGRSYDASLLTQLTSSSTVAFHLLLETTNPSNPASGSLFRYSGAGAPAVLVSLSTTSSVMTELTADVSSFFRPGQAPGIFAVTINLTTGSTTDYATSSGAWLEFTP